MAITLDIIREDLSFLYVAKMEWVEDFQLQTDRFEDVLGNEVDYYFRNAYWLPDWTSAMIFRSYHSSIGAICQILLDNAEGIDPYVVLTNEEF
jgi:hypothetical protein